jgi:protein TonB
MVLMQDSSRMPAALAAAIALHMLVLGIVASRGPVRLSLVPAPLVIDIVAASDRTAGPGVFSEQLRVASAPAPAAPSEAVKPAQPGKPRNDEPRAVPAEKPVQPKKAQPATKAAAASAVASERPANAKQPQPAPLDDSGAETGGSQGDGASARGQVASIGAGSDSANAAPAWAPLARVQYESVLYAWINRHKLYPMLAQRRGLQGTAAVRVRIDRDGRVIDRSLDRSTGEVLLDEAALDIVRRASPFPKVPPEYSGSTFEFVAPIEYRLH